MADIFQRATNLINNGIKKVTNSFFRRGSAYATTEGAEEDKPSKQPAAKTTTKADSKPQLTTKEKEERDRKVSKLEALIEHFQTLDKTQFPVGVFRTSENAAELKALLANPSNDGISSLSPGMTAVAIKNLVRDLNPPLLPEKTQTALAELAKQYKAAGQTDEASEKAFQAAVQAEISKVPAANNPTLKNGDTLLSGILNSLLHAASPDDKTGTKMPISNLALVVAPNLFIQTEPNIAGQDPMKATNTLKAFAELQSSPPLSALLTARQNENALAQANATAKQAAPLEVAAKAELPQEQSSAEEDLSTDFIEFINARAAPTLPKEPAAAAPAAKPVEPAAVVEPKKQATPASQTTGILSDEIKNHPLTTKIEGEVAKAQTAMDQIRARVAARQKAAENTTTQEAAPSASPKVTRKSVQPLSSGKEGVQIGG